LIFRQILKKEGILLLATRDRHGIFERSPREKEPLEERRRLRERLEKECNLEVLLNQIETKGHDPRFDLEFRQG
jgi:hypothetical protein